MKLERSCGAVVFTRTEEEPMYVLVRSHKGHYGFPKGHMETGETEEETALREIREETGLDARLISGFKETDEYPVNAEGDLKRVTFYLGEYTEKRVAPLEKDVAEAVSLSFEEAVERLTHESLRRILAAAHAFILKAPKPYYEAYEERYKAAHEKGVCWFDGEPSNVVARVMERYGITRRSSLLEIGCGEGRDAGALLQSGFDLTATDVSPEAIAYCRGKWPEYAARFKVLDCVKDSLEERFDFVIKKEIMETQAVKKLLQVLNSPEFRREIAHFSGNDYRDLGKIITEV